MRSASLPAFQRKKCGVCMWSVWASRLAHISWSRKAPGVSTDRCRSKVRQPSSFREGPTNARSSASRSVSCPSRARKMTTCVTASFGSFPPDATRLRLFGLARLRALAFRLAIMAGIVAQIAARARNRWSGRPNTGLNEKRVECLEQSPASSIGFLLRPCVRRLSCRSSGWYSVPWRRFLAFHRDKPD